MDPIKLQHNDTTKFLLPILFPHITHIELFTEEFEQAYIGKLDDEQFDDTIILKCNESYDLSYIEENCIGKLLSSDETLLVFDLPEDIKEEYEKFLNGEYSQFSERSKKDILNFWDTDEDSLLYTILYPEKRKDQPEILKQFGTDTKPELWGPPNIIKNELIG